MTQSFYAFLQEIPADILSAIDLAVLHHPSAGENNIISRLSASLEKYIVIYKREHVSTGLHLCRVLKPALLSTQQLTALTSAERALPNGYVLVAYEKPLALADSYQLH
jgi:hypothetical protein